MKNSIEFYKNLKPVTSFIEALDIKNHSSVPEDWHLVFTDVMNSTIAIEEGKYKDVNIAGGITAMAVSNLLKDMEYPFIFGGDGITFLIHNSFISDVRDILFDTKQKIYEFFELNLRIASISLKELYEKGYKLTITKFKVSPYYYQAIFEGNAIDKAEEIFKDSDKNKSYLIHEKVNKDIEADFSGFSCKWKDIPSSKEETISTIIKIKNPNNNEMLLHKIINKMEDIFGDENNHHPVTVNNLHIDSDKYLKKEAKVKSLNNSLLYYLRIPLLKLQAIGIKTAIKFNIPIKVNWYSINKLKEFEKLSSDYKKYDGTVKIVLSCNKTDRIEWENYLEKLFLENKIFYGIHISDRAIITCILHSKSEKEVHFIDAADGGYAIAAKYLKNQIKSFNYNKS